MGILLPKESLEKHNVFVPIITGSTGRFGNHTTFFVILKANAEFVIDELTPIEDGTNPSSTKQVDVSAKETRMRYIYVQSYLLPDHSVYSHGALI
jgi:hypothetical protein